jgi:lipopolysaccharide export LptBFGC system permease protein LptF
LDPFGRQDFRKKAKQKKSGKKQTKKERKKKVKKAKQKDRKKKVKKAKQKDRKKKVKKAKQKIPFNHESSKFSPRFRVDLWLRVLVY